MCRRCCRRWLSVATAARAHARELLKSVAPEALAGEIAKVEEKLNERMADLTILTKAFLESNVVVYASALRAYISKMQALASLVYALRPFCSELWAALKISKQGAMDLLRPLVKTGLVKRVGTLKTGRYVLK